MNSFLGKQVLALFATVAFVFCPSGTALAMDVHSWFWTTASDASPLPFSECVRRGPAAIVAGAGLTPTQYGTNPEFFWGETDTTSVMLMCIGEPRGFYMVLDVVVTSGSSLAIGNAIGAAFWGTGSSGSTGSGALGGNWQLNSNCTWASGGWQSTLTLNEAADGSLTGTVQTENLGSNGMTVLSDANGGWNNPSTMQSRVSGYTMTLVLHPNSWDSVLQLTGQLSSTGISGSVHHYGSDDCSFSMVRT